MPISTYPAQRLLLAGGFALAVAAAPLLTALAVTSDPGGSAVATCPTGEVTDPTTGGCKPATLNPLDPEKLPLETGSITNSRTGNVGELGEVAGIPCTGTAGGGGSTGECIGLAESQNANQYQAPKVGLPSVP